MPRGTIYEDILSGIRSSKFFLNKSQWKFLFQIFSTPRSWVVKTKKNEMEQLKKDWKQGQSLLRSKRWHKLANNTNISFEGKIFTSREIVLCSYYHSETRVKMANISITVKDDKYSNFLLNHIAIQFHVWNFIFWIEFYHF